MSDQQTGTSSSHQEPQSHQPPPGGGTRRPQPTTALRLNPRQQQYLDVIFELDQQAERDQRRRWHQGLPRQAADQWRWIPYTTHHAHASLTPAQQALDARGIQSTGSNSTLTALIRRGLLERRDITIDSTSGPTRQTQLRLTATGRQNARAARPSTNNGPTPLPPWLHEALVRVASAPPPGLAKVDISRVAARRLGPKEYGYIEDSTAWSYILTETGRDYLAISQQQNGTSQ